MNENVKISISVFIALSNLPVSLRAKFMINMETTKMSKWSDWSFLKIISEVFAL